MESVREHLGIGHRHEFGVGDDGESVISRKTGLPSDRCGSEREITRHDIHLHPRRDHISHRFGHRGTNGIDHRYEAEHSEVFFDHGDVPGRRVSQGDRSTRESEIAQGSTRLLGVEGE